MSDATPPDVVDVHGLLKRFGTLAAVDHVSLTIRRLGRRALARPREGAHRLHVAGVRPLSRPHGGREPGVLRRRVQPRCGARGAARLGQDGHAPRRARRPAVRRALGWPEAAARARVRDDARPRGGVPRRAHRRRGPRGAAPLLDHHPRACRRGRHDDRDDPLHGRGRALRPAGLPLARPPRGARLAGRGEAAVRPRRLARGHLRGAAGCGKMNLKRLHAMVRKEFVQMRRDPATLRLMLAVPLAQLLIFGYAIRTDVRHLPTVVFDQSRTQQSRAFVQSLTATDNFVLASEARSYPEALAAVDAGRARAAVILPPDYARSLKRGRTAAIQVLVADSDPTRFPHYI